MKHDNREYGSLATPCNRCNLEFVFQSAQPNIGWTGKPCKVTPYTHGELFAISKMHLEHLETWLKNIKGEKN
jgi:hypothetical protein